jgi:hypothetical protein
VQLSTTISAHTDLSCRQLELLPATLFTVGAQRLITHLNLRHNALRERCAQMVLTASRLGWLDDLVRLQSLRTVNLAHNNLSRVPRALFQVHIVLIH